MMFAAPSPILECRDLCWRIRKFYSGKIVLKHYLRVGVPKLLLLPINTNVVQFCLCVPYASCSHDELSLESYDWT